MPSQTSRCCRSSMQPRCSAELRISFRHRSAAGYTPITISAGTAWCLSMVAGYLCESEGIVLSKLADGSATWEDGKLEKACNKLIQLSKYFQKTAAGDDNDVATSNFYTTADDWTFSTLC